MFYVVQCQIENILYSIFRNLRPGLWQLIRRSIGTGMQWCKEWRQDEPLKISQRAIAKLHTAAMNNALNRNSYNSIQGE